MFNNHLSVDNGVFFHCYYLFLTFGWHSAVVMYSLVRLNPPNKSQISENLQEIGLQLKNTVFLFNGDLCLIIVFYCRIIFNVLPPWDWLDQLVFITAQSCYWTFWGVFRFGETSVKTREKILPLTGEKSPPRTDRFKNRAPSRSNATPQHLQRDDVDACQSKKVSWSQQSFQTLQDSADFPASKIP